MSAVLPRLWDSLSFWGMANAALNAGYALVVIPFQVALLPARELGIWYIFASLATLVLMLSSGGFCLTLQRFASYFYGGAHQVHAQGVMSLEESAGPHWENLQNLKRAADRLFGGMSAGLVLLVLPGGLLVMMAAWPADDALGVRAELGWSALLLAAAVQIVASGHAAVIQGCGGMLVSLRWLAFSRLANPLVVAISLHGGLGIISLGAGALAMGLIQLLAHQIIWRRLALPADSRPAQDAGAVLKAIWPNSWRLMVSGLGAWMITLSGSLLAGEFLGLSEAGRFGLSLQIFQFCSTMAATWMTTAIPAICVARAAGRGAQVVAIFHSRWWRAMLSFVILAAIAIVSAPQVLAIFGRDSRLLPVPALLGMAVIFGLECNHGAICASFLVTGNRVPFVIPALVSGIATIALSLLLLAYTRLGIWSMIISQGLVQVAYNNWRWPLLALRECRELAPMTRRVGETA